MDKLCCLLQNSDLGCNVGSVKCNYLAYADDYCLIASSVTALQKLINICVEYADAHSITFNASKTFCQAFMSRGTCQSGPAVTIGGQTIQWAANVKYLGYEISCWDRDKCELQRRKRELYARANLISSRFRNCSFVVKKYMFNTFFSNIYCMSLWCPVEKTSLKSVQVAYNDAFRLLFGYSRRSSASSMFAENGIPDFLGIRRKAVMSLLTRLSTSSNPLIYGLFNSRMLLDSSLYQSWRNLILCNIDENNDYDLYNIICNYTLYYQ